MKRTLLSLICICLFGACFSQTTHWNPNHQGFQYNMSILGVVLIDGEEQYSETLELGAFYGDECREAVFPFEDEGEWLFMLTIGGEVGESYSFRLYDHATQQELNLTCSEEIDFEIDGMIGFDETLYQFVFVTPPTTFTLSITGYGSSTGGYYLIAPPFDNVNPSSIEGMTTGDFDLYYFDEGEEQEWRNYEAAPFNLASGKGYLYAHSTNVTLSFTGTPYSGNGQVILSKTAGAEFEGWNLVGNPFPQVATVDRDCYVMKSDGTEIIVGSNRTVNPMQGVFVLAVSDNEAMSFVPQGNPTEGGMIVCNVLKDRSFAIDRAIVRFEGTGALPKFMLHPENTKLYIPNEDAEYAVVTRSIDNTTPICFKANENGIYTLNIDVVNLDMDYLHLVDNKTGADIDMLQTSNYTFEANTNDSAGRFKLLYAKNTGLEENTEAKPFAHYNGKAWVVDNEGQAMLQVLDMSGRTVGSMVISGDTEVNVDTAPGVYVFRLINGDSVRTQKVVVE